MNNDEGKRIIDNLEWLKEIQEKENAKKSTEHQIRAVEWAEHYIRSYFGMETDNFLTDLTMEIKHLSYLAAHITNQDRDFDSFEIMLKIVDLSNSLTGLHNQITKEDIENDES